MAHGTPDWGLVGPKTITYGLDDLGELAVRLGTGTVWDRRGDVIFYDDFEGGGGKVATANFGTGSGVRLTTSHVWHGAYSLELDASSVLADGMAGWAQGQYLMPRPNVSNLGYEIWFGMHTDTSEFIILIIYHIRPRQYVAGLRYDHVNSTFDYRNAAGGWTPIVSPIILYSYEKPVHTMKLVCDPGTQQYIRAILDDVCYPLPGIPMENIPGGLDPHVMFTFAHYGVYQHSPVIRVDNIIVTQNEPS